jgi:hypothetical protein
MPVIEIYRARIDPANVDRLMEIRAQAVAEFREQAPELLQANLVRLEDDVWLDVLVWSAPIDEQRISQTASCAPKSIEMHALISDVLGHDRGEIVHSTGAHGRRPARGARRAGGVRGLRRAVAVGRGIPAPLRRGPNQLHLRDAAVPVTPTACVVHPRRRHGPARHHRRRDLRDHARRAAPEAGPGAPDNPPHHRRPLRPRWRLQPVSHRTAAGSAAGGRTTVELPRSRSMASPKCRRFVEGSNRGPSAREADGPAIGAPFGNGSENPPESAPIEGPSAWAPRGWKGCSLQAKSGVQCPVRFVLPCRRSPVRLRPDTAGPCVARTGGFGDGIGDSGSPPMQ